MLFEGFSLDGAQGDAFHWMAFLVEASLTVTYWSSGFSFAVILHILSANHLSSFF